MARPLVILALFAAAMWILTSVSDAPTADNLRRHGAIVREEGGEPIAAMITPSTFPADGWRTLRRCETLRVLHLREPLSAGDVSRLKEWLPRTELTTAPMATPAP